MNRQDKNHSSSSTHPRTPRRVTLSVIAAAMALVLAVAISACGGGSSATGAAGGSSSPSDASGSAPTSGPGSAASVNVVGTEGEGAPTSDSKPKSGGTINYAHEMEVPCLTGGWIQEAYIERQYADSLVSEEKGGKIVPWLATSWKTSK